MEYSLYGECILNVQFTVSRPIRVSSDVSQNLHLISATGRCQRPHTNSSREFEYTKQTNRQIRSLVPLQTHLPTIFYPNKCLRPLMSSVQIPFKACKIVNVQAFLWALTSLRESDIS